MILKITDIKNQRTLRIEVNYILTKNVYQVSYETLNKYIKDNFDPKLEIIPWTDTYSKESRDYYLIFAGEVLFIISDSDIKNSRIEIFEKGEKVDELYTEGDGC